MCDLLSNWLVMSVIGLVDLSFGGSTPHRHWIMFNLPLVAHVINGNFHPFRRPLTVPLQHPNGRKMPAFGAVQGDCGRVYLIPPGWNIGKIADENLKYNFVKKNRAISTIFHLSLFFGVLLMVSIGLDDSLALSGDKPWTETMMFSVTYQRHQEEMFNSLALVRF